MKTKKKPFQLVIITGLSGSGKSTALKFFEDSGFYCVDNLPAALINVFVDLCKNSTEEFSRVALCLDTRERKFFDIIPETLEKFRSSGENLTIVFLDSSDEAIMRRYSETRRKHPIQGVSNVMEGIKREREILSPIRGMADTIIDTTDMQQRDLRKELNKYIFRHTKISKLNMNLVSFGYRYGIPTESDIVIDVRFLPNPFFTNHLRSLTGLDRRVQNYILKFRDTKLFLKKWVDFLKTFMPGYINEGKKYVTISFGCTGGVHRSVAIVEILKKRLRIKECELTVKHRDIEK